MRQINGFLADKKGQLDINRAVGAVLGLALAVVFPVIAFVVVWCIINYGTVIYDAVIYDAVIINGASYETFSNSIDLRGLGMALVCIILLIVGLIFFGIIWWWWRRLSSE